MAAIHISALSRVTIDALNLKKGAIVTFSISTNGMSTIFDNQEIEDKIRALTFGKYVGVIVGCERKTLFTEGNQGGPGSVTVEEATLALISPDYACPRVLQLPGDNPYSRIRVTYGYLDPRIQNRG